MATGKNIEIKIAATGGDQAAAEIKKVDKAAENLSGGGSGMGLKALTTEANKVTAAGVKMGTGMQNVGYQVQDVAVQIGSGTSAFRALGQQLPQLLSGFGPMGLALGTISAVALPVAGALFNMAEATEEVTDATTEAIDATVEMAREQALTGTLEAESLTRKKSLTETLRQITEAQYGYNESLQEQLGILSETQAIENEIAAAKGELEIDQAEGDPVKQEEVKNRIRKEAQARELAQLEERRKAGSDLIDRKGAQELEVGEAGAAEAASLRNQADTVGAEALQQEQLAALKKADAEDKTASAGNAKGAAAAALKREAAKLREEFAQAEEKAKSLRGEEKDLNSQADTVESTTQAEVERLSGEANKLFDEVEKLKREAEKKQEIFGIRDQQGDIREGRVRSQTAEKAARDKQKAEDKAAKADQDSARDNLTGKESALEESSKSGAAKIFGSRTAGKNTTARGVATALENGTNEDEIAKLTRMVNEKSGSLGAAMTQALREVLAGLEKQAGEISVLRSQIKTNRTGQ